MPRCKGRRARRKGRRESGPWPAHYGIAPVRPTSVLDISGTDYSVDTKIFEMYHILTCVVRLKTTTARTARMKTLGPHRKSMAFVRL